MRRLALTLVASASLAVPARAQSAAAPMVTVHARIVLVDRARTRGIGLRWFQVGGGRIRVEGSGAGAGRGGVAVAGATTDLSAAAFIELAQRQRMVSSDSRLQVATTSGSTASVASGSLSIGRWGGTRETGPELVVTPTVLGDGTVRLAVRARQRDEATSPYGHGASGSPVDAATTIVVRPGEDATVATVALSERRSDAGLLHWSDATGSRDALVVLRVEVGGR